MEIKLRNEPWIPEKISTFFAQHHIEKISHEAIYRSIYHNKKVDGNLYKHLRHRFKTYLKRISGRELRGRIKKSNHDRRTPSIVDEHSSVKD